MHHVNEYDYLLTLLNLVVDTDGGDNATSMKTKCVKVETIPKSGDTIYVSEKVNTLIAVPYMSCIYIELCEWLVLYSFNIVVSNGSRT